MFEPVVNAAGGEGAYEARRATFGPYPDSDEIDALMAELKTRANVGKLMQTGSVKNSTAFAQTYHYSFYAGEGTFLTKTA